MQLTEPDPAIPALVDRAMVEDAVTLMELHGLNAALTASRFAKRSRNLGNVLHYCRWRQVERLIGQLALDAPRGRLH
jgi:hypothetical protein